MLKEEGRTQIDKILRFVKEKKSRADKKESSEMLGMFELRRHEREKAMCSLMSQASGGDFILEEFWSES